MLRKVTILAILVSLILPIGSMAATKPNPIQPLQIGGVTFCTAFSINEKEGNWGTAAHCATHGLDKVVTILGQEAYVAFIGYPEGDVAVYRSKAHAPALKLAKSEVKVGDSIQIIGFPYGIGLVSTRGYMAAHDITMVHNDTGYFMRNDILDITVAGGNSGSPVLNGRGEVAGVLWGGFHQSMHAIGVPYDVVVRLIGAYWQR